MKNRFENQDLALLGAHHDFARNLGLPIGPIIA